MNCLKLNKGEYYNWLKFNIIIKIYCFENKKLIFKYVFQIFRIIKLIYCNDIIQIIYLCINFDINMQFELIFEIVDKKLKLLKPSQPLVLKEIKVIEAIPVSEFKFQEDFYGEKFYRQYKPYI